MLKQFVFGTTEDVCLSDWIWALLPYAFGILVILKLIASGVFG